MKRRLASGEQNFSYIRENNLFYVDKTHFIDEWWNSAKRVTLITRPRRFGKTLILDTVRSFFSREFANRSDLFDGLIVWKNKEIRRLQGTIPVISLSFADIKCDNYEETIDLFNDAIVTIYNQFRQYIDFDSLSDTEKEQFASVRLSMSDATSKVALRHLARYLANQSKKLPIILLDEYDAPMQEAWIHGYWDKLMIFMRGFFNSTFKTNQWLGNGLITGITRIAQESIFSDMNNCNVVTITSNHYSNCFGFTEQEVLEAMEEYGLADKDGVKYWYDGVIFGKQKSMYNPWSITKYLEEKILAAYWAQTSSNAILSELIAKGTIEIKDQIGTLLQGESITTKLDEQVVFSQLYMNRSAIWSLLLAAGYVKPLSFDPSTEDYEITLTNHEVNFIINKLVSTWFNNDSVNTNSFCLSLFSNNVKEMNKYFNEIAMKTFSFFDVKGKEPESFYHGFVLGLTVDCKDRFDIYSNRESGYGRFDIIMIPNKPRDHGIVIEFKTLDVDEEKSLEDTCANALLQIHEKKYICELYARNISSDNIYVYGFAFKGKDVLICGGKEIDINWDNPIPKKKS